MWIVHFTIAVREDQFLKILENTQWDPYSNGCFQKVIKNGTVRSSFIKIYHLMSIKSQ